nr:hypothetical protein ICEMyc226_00306 [Mycolicibacterium sp.]
MHYGIGVGAPHCGGKVGDSVFASVPLIAASVMLRQLIVSASVLPQELPAASVVRAL